jgi:hypothetical protein
MSSTPLAARSLTSHPRRRPSSAAAKTVRCGCGGWPTAPARVSVGPIQIGTGVAVQGNIMLSASGADIPVHHHQAQALGFEVTLTKAT